MVEASKSTDDVAHELRLALETADLSMFGELLDDNVTWGPPDVEPAPCQNRQQVLAWYQRARASGARATISEVDVIGSRILVGLVTRGTPDARDRGGHATRWQIYSVREGRVVDIVGFEQKTEALAWLSRA